MSNQAPQQKPIINVLSLDGGGIRGLIPLRFLQGLEDATSQNVHNIFHTIVGTSTGGFITALLSLPSKKNHAPVPAGEALKIYKDLGPEIFPIRLFGFKHYLFFLLLSLFGAAYIFLQIRLLRTALPVNQQTYSNLLEAHPWTWTLAILFLLCIKVASIFSILVYKCFSKAKYSGKSVVDFCRGHFKPQTKLKDAFTNVGLCATDIKKRRSFIFNSMRSKINHDCLLHSAEIAKIARATSAAPTYFSPEFFTIVPKEDIKAGLKAPEEAEKQKEKVKLVNEMTPWDSREQETCYDRRFIAFEDGGTKMNNPSKAAIKLAKMQLKQEGKDPDDYEIRLLSVGTGSISGEQEDPTITYHNGWIHWLGEKGLSFLDKFHHERWTGSMLSVVDRRLTGDVFEVLINAHNDHLEVKQYYKEKNLDECYKRQQFKISDEQLDGMDDCSKENMESLISSAEKMILGEESNRRDWSKAFQECVEFLDLKIVNKPVVEDFGDVDNDKKATKLKEE